MLGAVLGAVNHTHQFGAMATTLIVSGLTEVIMLHLNQAGRKNMRRSRLKISSSSISVTLWHLISMPRLTIMVNGLSAQRQELTGETRANRYAKSLQVRRELSETRAYRWDKNLQVRQELRQELIGEMRAYRWQFIDETRTCNGWDKTLNKNLQMRRT